ncbi:MAG TPA: 4-hydroxythreonine-4-phosphate dehydrogenase PdxA [Deltaproteobacteria bacterium]|nr:4-hydroxythreonine-4-phosphate dehydrogenase PdxA [Deltaproteobacteria bacterium]HQB39731.1 4-hydroxythreonine-4-phosphate dehydrogenase PdxA [Deltaproteobacteria bacterium]
MSTQLKKPLMAITMGDPCGIGPEIVVSALSTPEVRDYCIPFVVGDPAAIRRAIAVCREELEISEIAEPGEARLLPARTVALLPISSLADADMRYGQPTAASGDAAFRYICAAAQYCLSGCVSAMVTAPINKEAMNRAGHDFHGHTELLAELCGTKDFVMMLAGDVLRVSLVTIHEALADVPGLIDQEKILKTIRVTNDSMRLLLDKPRPRIAVTALNPHCGENGMFGTEDEEIIRPAVQMARGEGIDVSGPLAADTLFHFAAKGAYDAVVAMYHDQGLIPLKLLHFDDGVNITLGLPIIRTSVDHGTAYDLAGSGRASERSMLAAIRMAASMANNRCVLAVG